MATTPAVGERVEVRARRSDGRSEYVLGAVQLEDLSGVLTRITHRDGPRGPNGEMTQWMLQQGAKHLSQQLGADLGVAGDQALPPVLSRLVGHEPFATDVLGLSVHQISRRWPRATDWYGDLMAYVMRPARITQQSLMLTGRVAALGARPFGDVARTLSHDVLDSATDPTLYKLPDIVEAMWPDHPLVVDATLRSRRLMEDAWTRIYGAAFAAYGLRVRSPVTLADVVWTLQALASWDIREQRVAPDPAGVVEPLDGRRWARSGRSAMVYLVGALETSDGQQLTYAELHARSPRGDSVLTS